MKNIKYITLVLIAMLFTACTEVVNIPLNTAPPKLVVEASINWIKGTAGNSQKIKLSTTTDFYSTSVPPAIGATVYITASDNTVFNFTPSTLTDGEYVCQNFIPALNQEYTLTVIYNGQTYTATETMRPVPPIDKIEQIDNGGFSQDQVEIRVYFTDNGATKDFYFFEFQPGYAAIPTLGITEDEFFNGNQIYGIFTDEKLSTGDEIKYSLNGISQRYFNYMNIILGLANGSGGGPFSSPPATARGNVVNTTNENNYALGFFTLSESDSGTYTVK